MTTSEEPPLAVKGVLFDGTADDAKKSLQKSLERKKVFEAVRHVVGVVGDEALDAIRAEIVRQADEMISAPVVDAIMAAWRTYDQLVDAGRATVADARKTELVDLSSTEITSKNTWTVEVSVGALRMSIDFTLTVVVDLHSAVATVRGGKIMSIGDGRCTIHATFSAMDQMLADREKRVDLHDHLSFDPGLILVRPAPTAPAVEPPGAPGRDRAQSARRSQDVRGGV